MLLTLVFAETLYIFDI